jgi:cephalosporin hydroxylase
MRGAMAAFDVEDRTVWVADSFRATPEAVGGPEADLNEVRTGFARFGLLDERVRFLQGDLRASLSDASIDKIAVLRVGRTAGADADAVLESLYERMATGGFVIIEDASDPQCREAVESFRSRHQITAPLTRMGWSGCAWRKDATPFDSEPSPFDHPLPRAPLAERAPVDTIDLSVVVVFYNMDREAARTLHSLSRAYQEGVDDLDYEVLAIENGSDDAHRLGEEFVRSFGPEFRYIDLADDARPSPTEALNRGIACARGRVIALMIDGAHVVTPGVLKYGMVGLRAYGPAVVATQQWYVGPGQQPEVVERGYDEEVEDELFSRIEWPADGYRLFDIGHFIGDRDWFDGILESNCLFVPRSLLEQVGGFDDSFSMPGGEYANLDLWERLASSPDVAMVTILGEGSFHQIHGGTTTNDGVSDDRRSKIVAYGEHYRALRGRLMRGPSKHMHYVGTLAAKSARRTRGRRLTTAAFGNGRTVAGPDGLPEFPEPVPDALKETLVETYWRGLSWQHSTWLGQPVAAAPTDLVVYQEIIASVRPDWIIETGTFGGGRALFFASICDLLGHGRVVSVGNDELARPEHARVDYVVAPPHEPAAAEAVRAIVGDDPNALVLLGSRNGTPRLVNEFEMYAPLVRIGSYVIVENTIVNGHPVWPGYGPGPAEALRRILPEHGEFVQDTAWEKHALTFNPGGFLRRIS